MEPRPRTLLPVGDRPGAARRRLRAGRGPSEAPHLPPTQHPSQRRHRTRRSKRSLPTPSSFAHSSACERTRSGSGRSPPIRARKTEFGIPLTIAEEAELNGGPRPAEIRPVLEEYAAEHPDEYAGLMMDQDAAASSSSCSPITSRSMAPQSPGSSGRVRQGRGQARPDSRAGPPGVDEPDQLGQRAAPERRRVRPRDLDR